MTSDGGKDAGGVWFPYAGSAMVGGAALSIVGVLIANSLAEDMGGAIVRRALWIGIGLGATCGSLFAFAVSLGWRRGRPFSTGLSLKAGAGIGTGLGVVGSSVYPPIGPGMAAAFALTLGLMLFLAPPLIRFRVGSLGNASV